MQIQVLLFGITRDIIGQGKINLDVSCGITVEALKRELANAYSDLNNYNYSVAINEAYAEVNTVLNDNDTVALIPPVSGG